MFSNTAYEALYEYLGLELHGKFIEVLTSQRIFWAALVLIFAVMFLQTTAGFFSRYMSGELVKRRHVRSPAMSKSSFAWSSASASCASVATPRSCALTAPPGTTTLTSRRRGTRYSLSTG